MMQILREKTKWVSCQYTPKNMDYLLNDDGRLIAVRRIGDGEKWQKFSKPMQFSKRWRSFTKLREPMPTEFIKPSQADPWENMSYNSLEAYM